MNERTMGLNEDFVKSMNDYIDATKSIEILKAELRQMKSTSKKMLDSLIEEGETIGVDESILELLKSFKFK